VEEIKKIASEKSDEEALTVMGKLVHQISGIPELGDLVEGPVISIEKSSIYVDLEPFGTGIIYGREFLAARDLVKKINIGDAVTAKVVESYLYKKHAMHLYGAKRQKL